MIVCKPASCIGFSPGSLSKWDEGTPLLLKRKLLVVLHIFGFQSYFNVNDHSLFFSNVLLSMSFGHPASGLPRDLDLTPWCGPEDLRYYRQTDFFPVE